MYDVYNVVYTFTIAVTGGSELVNWGQFINPHELMFDSTGIPW